MSYAVCGLGKTFSVQMNIAGIKRTASVNVPVEKWMADATAMAANAAKAQMPGIAKAAMSTLAPLVTKYATQELVPALRPIINQEADRMLKKVDVRVDRLKREAGISVGALIVIVAGIWYFKPKGN